MAIQYFDLGDSLAKGIGAAALGNEVRQKNALADVFKQHGSGIMSGDPVALNALAAVDPTQALSISNNMAAQRRAETQAGYAQNQEARAAKEFAWKAAEYAKGEDAAKVQAEIDKIDLALAGASHFYEQGDQQGYANFLRKNGIKPEDFPFNSFPAYAQKFGTARDAMAGVLERQKGEKPADTYQRYVQEEQAAGRKPLTRLEFMKAGQKSSEIRVAPDGSVSILEGGAAGGGDTAGLDVAGPGSMIRSIDGILGDEALDWSTGMLSFMQQVPGTGGRRVGARIKQLDGQAFLNAFESLKGGGQITEIEGQKATEAVGRLDSAQRAEDYRAALEELRSLLVLGQSRPKGWVGNREQDIPEVGTVEGGYRFLGGDPAKPENWEQVQ